MNNYFDNRFAKSKKPDWFPDNAEYYLPKPPCCCSNRSGNCKLYKQWENTCKTIILHEENKFLKNRVKELEEILNNQGLNI